MTRLTLLLILALSAQVHAQSRKLVVAESPRSATVEGYEVGHCVCLRNRIRICKVLSEEGALFVIEKDGKTLGAWGANTYLGETDDFKVMHGDLEDDRKPELIIANRDSTSVGIGVSVWTIAIFPDTDFRSFQPPLTFSVKEYGTYGTFVTIGERLSILTTDWIWGEDPKEKRGQGLYLVGQWWRYHRGELTPSPKAIIARRYLLSFERERWDTIESHRIPYQWLTNRRAEYIATDFITGPIVSSRPGVIESVSSPDEKSPYRVVKIMFKPRTDKTSLFIYPNEDDNGSFVDRYLGDAATGKIYPANYLPSNPKQWLTGRRATLRTYKENKTEVLWLEPQRGNK
jgi:hypothetical protein